MRMRVCVRVCVHVDPQDEGCMLEGGGDGPLPSPELALVALVSLVVLRWEEEEEAVMKGSPVLTVLLT